MFLAWRELRVSRARFALVGLVIALIALLTTLLSGLATGLVDDGISGLRTLPLTHLALQPGAEKSFSRSTLTERNLRPWSAAKGVDVSALGQGFYNARAAGGQRLDLAVFGVPPGSFLAPRPEAQAALRGRAGIVLSDGFTKQGLRVGQLITISGSGIKLPILGFTYTGSYGHVDIAFTSLSTWQRLQFGDGPHDRFSAIAIRKTGADPVDLNTIDRAAGTETITKTQAYAGSPGFSAETATMTLIRGFLLIISALVVGAFFTIWTVQRTRQIGLMKALGASTSYVVRDALGQLLVILVIATLVGVAVALGLGSLVGSGVPFSLQAGPVIGSAAVLVILGMAGSLVALRRITRVDAIVALGADS